MVVTAVSYATRPGDTAQPMRSAASFTCQQPFPVRLEPQRWGRRVSDKTQVHNVAIELTVLLGRCRMPMQRLLRMGRGSVIPLCLGEDDQVWILAAGHPIPRGEITLHDDRLFVTVTEPADVHEFNAAG